MSITVRPAVAADLAGLHGPLRQTGALHATAEPGVFREAEPPLSADRFARLLADPECTVLVAEQRGAIVGVLIMSLRRTRDVPILVPRVTAHVNDLIVDEAHRRAGIGTALMEAARLWARAHGATDMHLNVWEFDREALRFYESLGYRVASRGMVLDLAQR